MGDPQRILIVRPSALGDVCRTVPVLVSLRKAFPKAGIDWVVQEEFVEAIRRHPALDEVVSFPRARLARWWRNPRVARETLGWFADLRRRGYDLVFDCQGLGRSGLITWATGARRRVGLRSAREFGWLGYTVRHAPSAATHTVEQMLSLLGAEGIEPVCDLTLYVTDEHREWWQQRQAALEIRGRRYAVLAPTSRWPSKRWPASHWSQIIDPLLGRGFERIVLIGARAEIDQARGIGPEAPGASPVIDLVGGTSLGESMAVIESAALVIANDSAPLHMAVGLGRPCLGLFGPTDPQCVGPYGREDAVLRTFAPPPEQCVNYKDPTLGDALMRLIRPADVLRRLDQMMESGRITHVGPAEHPPSGTVDSDLVQRATS